REHRILEGRRDLAPRQIQRREARARGGPGPWPQMAQLDECLRAYISAEHEAEAVRPGSQRAEAPARERLDEFVPLAIRSGPGRLGVELCGQGGEAYLAK